MNNITDELLEKTFLYCYKRIADKEMAKDLAQEIVFSALVYIKKGKKIDNFYGWYWTLANHKVIDFYRAGNHVESSIDDAAEINFAHLDHTLERLITKEETEKITSAMTKLAAIHRDIIIRYYIQNKSIKQIAKELSLPIGTVTSRLSDARKDLYSKVEKMEKLEQSNSSKKTLQKQKEYDFFFGGNAWNAIQVLDPVMNQAIAAVCAIQKKSINEIAELIDSNPVYLEEPIHKMIGAGVLVEATKGKYLTNFNLYPEEKFRQVLALRTKIMCDLNFAPRFFDILISLEKKIKSTEFYGSDFDWSYLMWYFSSIACKQFSKEAADYCMQKYGNGEKTETSEEFKQNSHVTGVIFTDKKNSIISDVGWTYMYNETNSKFGWIQFNIEHDYEPFDCCNGNFYQKGRSSYLTPGTLELIFDLVKNPLKKRNDKEMEQVAFFIEKGFVSIDKNIFKVNMPLMSWSESQKIENILRESYSNLAHDFVDAFFNSANEILSPFVTDSLFHEYLVWDLKSFMNPIHEVTDFGTRKKVFQIPKDYKTTAAGLGLIGNIK